MASVSDARVAQGQRELPTAEEMGRVYLAIAAEEWSRCSGPRVAISGHGAIVASGDDDAQLIEQAEKLLNGEWYFLDWHRDHLPDTRLP